MTPNFAQQRHFTLNYWLLLVFFAIIWLIASNNSFAQDLPTPVAKIQVIKSGSLVIAMDNTNQALPGYFNLKAYGLVNELLQKDIEIKWAIRSGKAKDGVDFSATAQREYPTALSTENYNFKAGPFIIDSINAALARPIIAAWGNSVAVYRLTQDVNADIRYNLHFKPRIMVFNNGGNGKIHLNYLMQAGFDTSKYVKVQGEELPFSYCPGGFTFASEAHWGDENDTSVSRPVYRYVANGGNFLAGCIAIRFYENDDTMHTTTGIDEINAGYSTFSYTNTDMAFSQIDGILKAEGGALHNWYKNTTGNFRSTQYAVVGAPTGTPYQTAAAAKIISPNLKGGNVFYLGGHDYGNGTKNEEINGRRMYLNAVFVPPGKAAYCNLNPLAANVSPNQVSCTGNTNGTVTLSVSGGLAPYDYQWSTGATTQNLSNLTPGTYSVTVTDDLGQTSVNSAVVIQPGVLLVASSTSAYNNSNISCSGGMDGSITLTVSGGTLPYIYSWSTGQTTKDLNNLGAGTYAYTVTDAYGCNFSGSKTLLAPTPLTPVSAVSDFNGSGITCNGATDGYFHITVNGGTAPYTYLWSTNQTIEDLDNIGAGTYSITVTDANGCKFSDTKTLLAPAPLNPVSAISDFNGKGVSCNGATDGYIHLTVSGGTTPYTYLWSNGKTIKDLNNIGAGTYSYSVTDANGCAVNNSFTISEPNPLNSPSAQSSYNDYGVKCNLSTDGWVHLNISGGTTPYTYQWSNGQTTQNLDNLGAGTYSYTITDANGCVANGSNILVAPNPLTAVSAKSDYNGSGVSCNGSTDGYVHLTVSGGTLQYFYQWSNGQTTKNLNNLGTGTYAYTVTDVNGCSANGSATLNAPNPLNAISAKSDFNGSGVSCNGSTNGYVNLTVSGGTSQYSYIWSNGQTTQNLNNLGAGTYAYTVTDANGCSANGSATLNAPNPLNAISAKSDFNGSGVSCNGSTNGYINLTVSGGTSQYSYQWSGGQTTQNLNNIGAGTYAYTVTDANGCLANGSATLNAPNPLNAVSAKSDYNGSGVSCNGSTNGYVNLTVSGGTSQYSYQWSSGQTTQNLNNLGAGTYAYTVTDANGCSVNGSQFLNAPNPLNAVSAKSDYNGSGVSCNGSINGYINLTVSGGTSQYSYQWSSGQTTQNLNNLGAGTYAYTVIDANGCSVTGSVVLNAPNPLNAISAKSDYNGSGVSCNGLTNGYINLTVSGGTTQYTYQWSTGLTTQNLNNIGAGTYSYTVTDANGCSVNGSQILNAPNPLNAVSAKSDYNGSGVSCNGSTNGYINLSVSGGTSQYNYQWSNGQVTQNLNNLGAGSYAYTVTDANGCSANGSVTLNAPNPLNAISTKSDYNGSGVSCNGSTNGFVNLNVSGGTYQYSYQWSTGQTTQNLYNIGAGTYAYIVTDANGCSASGSVTLNAPNPLSAISAKSDYNGSGVSCNGSTNGWIYLNINGGTSQYSYIWSNGQTTKDLNNIGAGSYTYVVIDVNGCSVSGSVILNAPNPLNAISAKSDYNGSGVSCNGSTNGWINLNISGGTSQYTYIWSNGQNTKDLNNIGAGSYTYTVIDANGCSTSGTVTLNAPNPLSAIAAQSNYNGNGVSCNGSTDGYITLTVTGGTMQYSYQWSNGQITKDLNNIGAGFYVVTVTDSNGCTAQSSAGMIEPPLLNVSAGDIKNILCNGNPDGQIRIVVSGGVVGFSYSWSNGATTQNISGLGSSSYTVIVKDANGCSATNSFVVTQPNVVAATTLISSPVSCNGFTNGSITVNVSGGTLPYQYIWSNGETTQTISNLPAGTYSVRITDAGGCTASNSITLNQPAPIIADAGVYQRICGNSTNLAAVLQNGFTGTWSIITGNAVINDVNNSASSINGLSYGSTLLQWFITDGICSAKANVLIDAYEPVTASAGANDSICPEKASVLMLNGSSVNIGTGTWNSLGSSTPDDLYNPNTSVSGLNTGNNTFVWTVSNGPCKASDTVTVYLKPQGFCEELDLPTGFTPNGDGFNDTYEIHGIDKFPNNTFIVFNRWGNEVFNREHYANAAGHNWEGLNNNGQQLPEGTYYVILVINKGEIKRNTYVDLRRE